MINGNHNLIDYVLVLLSNSWDVNLFRASSSSLFNLCTYMQRDDLKRGQSTFHLKYQGQSWKSLAKFITEHVAGISKVTFDLEEQWFICRFHSKSFPILRRSS